jgi:hypothetical protein
LKLPGVLTASVKLATARATVVSFSEIALRLRGFSPV